MYSLFQKLTLLQALTSTAMTSPLISFANKTFTLFAASMVTINCFGKDLTCPIQGEAISWASDACLWENETDDITNQDVKKCLESAQSQISLLGECDAKYLFKNVICVQAANWDLGDLCLNTDAPLGPTVQAHYTN